MDSTILISKYLKEYNCLYKEANEIYHEAARRLHLSDSAFEIFYALFDMGDNCLQRDICKASCLPKQTINSSIRKLQADGYLTLFSRKRTEYAYPSYRFRQETYSGKAASSHPD